MPSHKTVRDAAALALTATITILIAAMAPRAQQPPAPTGPLPPKPLVPVTATTLASNPDQYYGEWVSVTGVVEQSLSKLTFAVDQGKIKSSGDVLVLAPRLNSAVDPNTYVTVVGEVVRFDPDEISRKSKDYALDLSPEIVAKYRGRPAVLATSVINSKMIDLAKRLPPPMSAEEQAFADTEAFWKTKGKPDAQQWAQDARKQVDAIEHAASAGKWDEVKTAAGTLGQACQSCHTAYRERFDDGSYRIKTGG